MTTAAMRKTPDAQFDVEIEETAPARLGLAAQGAGAHASPVHEMQARLEEAVFASFSAKQNVGPAHAGGSRAIVIVVAAALGGWGLLFTALNLI